MALRLFLVSLVALMSFELPTHRDLTSWAESSGHWVRTSVGELSNLKDELVLAFTGLSRPEVALEAEPKADSLAQEIGLIRQDVAFEVAQENLVAYFRADLARIDDASPLADEVRPIVSIEKPTPPTLTEESAQPDLVVEVAGTSRAIVGSVPPVPVDRLANAVQLTRQALSAWASLLPSNEDRNERDSF